MNIWNKLVGLLPKPTRLVATIATVVSDGRYSVSTSGGGDMPVKGESGLTVGTRVFVSDGIIQGKAPSLPTETIDLY